MSDRFAMADLTGGQMNAIVKMLGGDEDARRFLDGQFIFVDPAKANKGVKIPAKPLFTFAGRFRTEGTKEFVAKKNFAVDTSEKARVKISYRGNNFEKYLLPLVERDIAPSDLVLSRLTRGQHDLPLDDENPGTIAGLGGTSKAVTGLYEFNETLAHKQAMGDLTWTVGYVRVTDEGGNTVLWAVGASWHDDGWYVEARSVSDPDGWHAGCLVLSR